MFDSFEISLQFEQSSWSPFLHFGITLAVLDIGGKIPAIQDMFIINESAIESSFINCFKRKVVTLLGPTALLIVVLLMLFCISFSFT